MNILITGGAGYIGSHTVLELLKREHEVTVVDSLINSSEKSLEKVEEITGRDVRFYKIDLCDRESVEKVFRENSFDAVIHFAGLKAVGESVKLPLNYYYNNLVSTLVLCKAMAKHNVKHLVFSSSATVYGDPVESPIPESASISPTNPYGRTKSMIEAVLLDLADSNARWQITILRYFNPIGADATGLIGEDPVGIPNNLLPYVAQVAVGERKDVKIFGNDYETKDGTGIRDYIHVTDLALGHISALEHAAKPNNANIYNLGSGKGYSVLEVINAFEKASGKKIPYTIVDRRPGDIGVCFAKVDKVNEELGWHALKNLEEACADTWKWQSNKALGVRGA